MTPAELEARVERLERTLASVAKAASGALHDPWTHPADAPARALIAIIEALQNGPQEPTDDEEE
jgi:hypothetical protein